MQLEGNILKPFPKVSPNFQHKIKSGRFRMKIFFWESVISGAMFEVFFWGGGRVILHLGVIYHGNHFGGTKYDET